jgi:hypothetical protein
MTQPEIGAFFAQLAGYTRDLLGFRFCIERWCEVIGFERAIELAQKVEPCFQIGQRHL